MIKCIALQTTFSQNYGMKHPNDKPFDVPNGEAKEQIQKGVLAEYSESEQKAKEEKQADKQTKEEKATYQTKEEKPARKKPGPKPKSK